MNPRFLMPTWATSFDSDGNDVNRWAQEEAVRRSDSKMRQRGSHS
jgi:hypothetical protein